MPSACDIIDNRDVQDMACTRTGKLILTHERGKTNVQL